MRFLLGIMLVSVWAAGPARAARRPEELKVDARTDGCASVAVAAKTGRILVPQDPALQACAQGTRATCERTRQLLESIPATRGQNLLPNCAGPQETAGVGICERVINACKLGLMIYSVCTGQLPVEPSVTNVDCTVTNIRGQKPVAPVPATIGGG